MAFLRKHLVLIAAAVTCAAAGAAVSAIASAGASTKRVARASELRRAELRHAGLGRHLRLLLDRGVHATAVVHTKGGFRTFTMDRGFVQGVSGQSLTIREGTKKVIYQVVTLTIPASARIRDNGQRASLSELRPGQRVIVIQGPGRTSVRAHTARAA